MVGPSTSAFTYLSLRMFSLPRSERFRNHTELSTQWAHVILGVKLAQHEPIYSLPSNAEIDNAWSVTYTSHTCKQQHLSRTGCHSLRVQFLDLILMLLDF
jgi:hypothetical protein